MGEVRSVLFCTPCYGGVLTEPHYRSCMNLRQDLTTLGIDHEWNTGRNESLVHRARMEMARVFLESSHSHLMWLDADIEFTSDDVAKLWNLNTDIAVGVYRMKKQGDLYAAWVNGALITDISKFTGPIEVDYAGTGFMLLSRTAIEGTLAYLEKRYAACKEISRMVDDDLDDKERKLMAEMVGQMQASYLGNHGRSPALFMTPIYNDGLESEDYNFCRVAREAGFKVIMDPSVKLRHWGQIAYGA